MSALRDMLVSMVSGFPDHPHFFALERFLLEHGREFIPQARPKGVRKRKDSLCFMNATQLALRDGWHYAEGIAMRKALGIPMIHGWCVDNDNRVIDPTWKDPADCEYLGIIIDEKMHGEQMMKHEVYGVLDPGRGINMEFIQEWIEKYGAKNDCGQGLGNNRGPSENSVAGNS